MKTVGIVCEYNPFHHGHARQLRLIRQAFGEDTAIVCAMSGSYVQRGEPAMWDKFTRAEAAVLCGADVVLELPVTRVLCSAEGFARGGVELLARFGADTLCFGAECGDGAALLRLAEKMQSPAVTERLHTFLGQGLPYPAARQLAVEDEEGLLRQPNNILGLEYCRAILSSGCAMQPFAIRRTGDYHAPALDCESPSATAIRAAYPAGVWRTGVPSSVAALLESAPWYRLDFGERAMLARLRGLTEDAWRTCAHGSEGLWSKAHRAARSENNYEAIVQAVKSKRYPRTRIQRLLLCAYLGITQETLDAPISYARVLALSSTGRSLLRQARDRAGFPLINPGQTPDDTTGYALETRAADLYTLFAAPGFPTPCRTEQNARIKIF